MKWFQGRSSFIVGSDRWMGGSSTKDSASTPPVPPEALDESGKSNEQLEQYNALSGLKVRSPKHDELDGASAPVSSSSGSSTKLYPEVYVAPQETKNAAPMETSDEILVRIPGAMAHLVDKNQSVLLGSGDFILEKLSQDGTGIALFARVGDNLRWPVVKNETVTKLDPSHYVFSLRVDPDEDDEASKGTAAEILNYGVTFKVENNLDKLGELDKILGDFSYFSAPKMIQADDKEIKKFEEEIAKQDSAKIVSATDSELAIGKAVPYETVIADKKTDEVVSTAFWTTIAPNVDDYNSSLARAIAGGSGHIIRGIFWCSETTVSQLQKGGEFLRRHSSACRTPSEISPATMRSIRSVKRVTRMSDKVAKGVLTGVVTVAGYFTSSVVTSKAGKKFFKLLPGEIALASLDGFGKVFDALEVAGTNVFSTSSVVTTGVVSHRYGDKAAELTREGISSVGHIFSIAWTVSKIRNAINPKNAMKPTSVLRTAAKTAAHDLQKKK